MQIRTSPALLLLIGLAAGCQPNRSTTPTPPAIAQLAPPAWIADKAEQADDPARPRITVESKIIERIFANGSSKIPSEPYQRMMSAKERDAYLKEIMGNPGVDVLSSPMVMALDGQVAQIQIGNELPVKNDDQIGIEFIGISQHTRAHYSPKDQTIKLDIYSLVREHQGYTESDSGVAQPIISTRRIDTTVNLAAGESILLGGLVTTITVQTEDKAPLLGDIPGLGRAFTSTSTQTNACELIFVVTATAVDKDGKPIAK